MELQDRQLEFDKNPLNQEMILKLVFEHVGKSSLTDLKNCRLVSHHWNKVAVQVLEQKGYAVELDFKKLLTFKSRLWNAQLAREQGHKELVSLRLSLDLRSGSSCSTINHGMVEVDPWLPRVSDDVEPVEHLSEIAQAAQLLILHPGLRVAFLSYQHGFMLCQFGQEQQLHPWGLQQNRELFSLLKLTASSLTDLCICYNGAGAEAHLGDGPGQFEKFNYFTSYSPLLFPRLTTLSYQTSARPSTGRGGSGRGGGVGGDTVFDMTNHVIAIVMGSHELTNLTLGISEGNIETSTHSLHRILQSCAGHLKELTIDERNEADMLKPLAQLRFPRLTTVRLINGLFGNSKWLNQFLRQNSPVLTNLEIVEWRPCTEHRRSPAKLSIDAGFPVLPSINRFALDLPYSTTSSWYLADVRTTFIGMLSKFPSLATFRLDLGVLFMLGAHLVETDHLRYPLAVRYPCCPTISTLDVHIPNPTEEMDGWMENARRIYHRVFPGAITLVIELNCYAGLRPESEEIIIRAVELLCSHPGIQNLEIKNYAYDWLTQETPSPAHLLQGQLKSLKLFPPEKSEERSSGREEQLRLKISEFVLRFPALEFLQLGRVVVKKLELQALRNVLGRCESPISI